MDAPPLTCGAFQESDTWALPAVAVGVDGGPAGPNGTADRRFDLVLAPLAFTARILTEKDTPFSRLGIVKLPVACPVGIHAVDSWSPTEKAKIS